MEYHSDVYVPIKEEEITPTKNTRITEQPINLDSNSWTITFDLYIDNNNEDDIWRNILRFTNTDEDAGTCGDRMPVIFRSPGTLLKLS